MSDGSAYSVEITKTQRHEKAKATVFDLVIKGPTPSGAEGSFSFTMYVEDEVFEWDLVAEGSACDLYFRKKEDQPEG